MSGKWCHFCRGFCKLNWCSCLKIFLVMESNLTFQRSCLFKSKCWNEIREMSVFEVIIFSFEIQTSLVKDPTHYSMQSFDCLVFWKQKWPVVRLKWFFSRFFLSILNSDFGYIFDGLWWGDIFIDFKNKMLGFIKKGFFFS